MKNLQVIKSEMFGKVECDFYSNNSNDLFWVTREQIGKAIEYADPETAIKNIHLRHADRLDKFSTKIRLSQVEGNRTVTRDVIAYNVKGIFDSSVTERLRRGSYCR